MMSSSGYRALLIGLFGTLLAHSTYAGLLNDLYLARPDLAPKATTDDPGYKAAEMDLQMQQRRYLPKIDARASELWISQSINQSGNVAFPSGSEQYRGRRMGIDLDQPLYDPTIRPQIDAARARIRQAQSLGRANTEQQTRALVEGFIKASRHHVLIESTQRVITRLETELAGVTRSQEARVATVSDVQNIRLALSATKLERSNHKQSFMRAIAGLGAEESASHGWSEFRSDANPLVLADAALGHSSDSPEVDLLYATADEQKYKAQASRRRSLPVISLTGYYGTDSADKSLFGGPRDFRFFEGGLTVRWAIFDRGMNLSEARQLAYRQRAAEAAALNLSGELRRDRSEERRLLDESAEAVNELAEIVNQHAILMDASTRSYAAGQESYMNSIRAYLSHESAFRDLTNARHDLLERSVAHLADAIGWNENLVHQVDALFITNP
jgi:outer membrane protein, protease secretion system